MAGTEPALGPRRTKVRAAGLFLAGTLLAGPISLGAQVRADETPSLRLHAPTELRVGQHARFALEVRLPQNAGRPVLLTPFREGQALEVVKGRLLRSDARDPEANPLVFELPVLARAPGSVRIGMRLLAYVCAPRCRAFEAETSTNVLVLP